MDSDGESGAGGGQPLSRRFDPSTGSGASRAGSRDDELRVVLSEVEGRPPRDRAEPGRSVTGAVTEQLPSGLYRVRLDDGPQIVAHIADRTALNFIRVLVGDRVRVELSGVDVTRGRIVEKVR